MDTSMSDLDPSPPLADLSLLAFLAASPVPTLVIPSSRLFTAAEARRDAYAAAVPTDGVLNLPGAGSPTSSRTDTLSTREEAERLQDVLEPLLVALVPEWGNESWAEWEGVNASGDWKRKGKKAARTRSGDSPTKRTRGASGSSSLERNEWGTDFLGTLDQVKLLAVLLDLIDHSQIPSSTYTLAPVNSIVLATATLTAVFTPTRSHLVISAAFVLPPRNAYQLPNGKDRWITKMNVSGGPTSESVEIEDAYEEVLGRTPVGKLIRDYDWESTSLGAIKDWGPELRTLITGILASPFREVVIWGEDLIMIYNDSYVHTCGAKHPRILGKTFKEGWDDVWDELEPIAANVMRGETFSVVDLFLGMKRGSDDKIDETYHSFAYIPYRRSSDSKVLGFGCISFETTKSVVAARRLSTLADLVHATSLAKTTSDFCASALSTLSENAFDFPFVVLYTALPVTSKGKHRQGVEEHERIAVELTRRGTIGVPETHPFAPAELTVDLTPHASRLSASSSSDRTTKVSSHDANVLQWSWPIEEACMSGGPVFVENLPAAYTSSLETRGWEDRPKIAVVIPIIAEVGMVPSAVLIVGLNPRGTCDALEKTFLHLISRHIAIGLLSVTTYEAEARRSAELMALDRAKTSFFSNVSHELRTPLTLILGPLDDVLSTRKDNLLREDRERLNTVNRHAKRLLTMVNKLLDFSSLEGGRMNFKFRKVQIGQLTADLAHLFRDAIERGKIRYIVECDDDPVDCLPIYLAPELWEKVMFNLIGNSFKYCLAGTISVTVRSTPAEAVVSVSDTGVGISESELPHVFERFHRVESTSRTTTGTGIGLALTLEIVKLLGGQLDVVSVLGQGSTFSVRFRRGFTHLPKEQVSHVPEDNVLPPLSRSLSIIEDAASWRYDDRGDPQQPSSATSSSGSATGSATQSSHEEYLVSADLLNLKNSTILLVDDSSDILSYVTSILSKSFTVVQASDGQHALDYLNSSAAYPNLIVTDVMMQRLDGRGLLAAIRTNPATALIPVIFLSAQAGVEARAEALEAGADDYLCKPFQARELLARVGVHLQIGRLRHELERRVEQRTRALAESETRYKRLADRYSTLSILSPVGVFMMDSQGEMTYANPRWYEISGHPLEIPLSRWRESILPEDLDKANSAVQAAVSGSPVEHSEFRFTQGNWVLFELRAFHDVSSVDTSGEGFVGACTDISRMKQVEELHLQTVSKRIEDVEENRRQQEQFIDMASHELRNPLSGVWQNAELLGHGLENLSAFLSTLDLNGTPDLGSLVPLRHEMVQNLEAVGSIILCVSHQKRIADDILNVSKLNMGMLLIERRPFLVTEQLSDVLRVFSVECGEKDIALSLKVDESVVALKAQCIVADSSRLLQIIINFLTNAVKYTSDAEVRKIVVHAHAYEAPPPTKANALRIAEPEVMELAHDNVWVVIGVEDSGKGLSMDELGKLFARFSQANPKSDMYGGSGLGLYVSKKLIELHSGFIEVESLPGHGSTFRFAIQAARGVIFNSAGDPSTLSGRNKRASVGQGRSLREGSNHARKFLREGTELDGIHILVVEDNIINQSVMRRQLQLANIIVTVASNGQEALDVLLAASTSLIPHPSPIRVILMDIEMPVMGGLDCIRTLREWEKNGIIPVRYGVIAVTGNARQSKSYCAAGFDDVAIKPYHIADLLEQIAKLLGDTTEVEVEGKGVIESVVEV